MSRQGKRRTRTLASVKDFWNREAQEWGENPRVTIRDHYYRLLEIDTVLPMIRGGDKVLDIGCGTGFSSIFYAQVVNEMIGADYAELMVERAQRFLNDRKYYRKMMKTYSRDGKIPKYPTNLQFELGDIVSINYPSKHFDVVIADRVLVNLPTVELQTRAISEVSRVLRPNGLWIVAEASKQGHKKIDSIRNLFGLPIMEKYWHNLYLDEPFIIQTFRKAGFSLQDTRRFETYQFLTKVIHPLTVVPGEPNFLAGFNRAAMEVARDFYDYQQVIGIGLKSFLKKFRSLLIQYDPDKVKRYDQVSRKVLSLNPNFTGCSHQVLYNLKRT